MKRFFLMTAILVSATFLLSSFSLRENPQDPPRGKKKERRIKLVKVDEDGTRTELDTVLSNDKIFVWHGDTIGRSEMQWFAKGYFHPDSLPGDMDFDFDFTKDLHSRVMIVKPDGDSTLEYRYEIRSDVPDGAHDVMVWHEGKGENRIFAVPEIPGVPPVPPVPRIRFLENRNDENSIDLSDPGIISYKRKKLKDGREKITIIRNEPAEKEAEEAEEIIIRGNGNQPAVFGVAPNGHKIVVRKNAGENGKFLEEREIIRKNEVKNSTEKRMETEIKVNREQENN